MIKRVQLIGHTKTTADAFLGKTREVTVNTTDLALRVHDGATIGGFELARANMGNVPVAGGAVDGKMTSAQADDLAAAKTSIDAHVGSTAGHPIATTGADGFESAADKTKLNGIETAAKDDQTGSEILALLLSVDGAGSGLDADLLDGLNQDADATADTIMRRDSAGRASIVDPSASDDIATKGYVDGIQTTLRGELNAPSGTKALFVQDSAPTGWTKDTDQDDRALRVVSGTPGTGGAAAFSSVFGSGKTAGATTLTTSHMPALVPVANASIANITVVQSGTFNVPHSSGGAWTAGGATSHNHTLSLDLQFMDVIKATKD